MITLYLTSAKRTFSVILFSLPNNWVVVGGTIFTGIVYALGADIVFLAGMILIVYIGNFCLGQAISKYVFYFFVFVNCTPAIYAQEKAVGLISVVPTVSAPLDLPGKGLRQHDFFYTGEGNKVMSIVKKGKVVWTYTDTTQHGEISDAVVLNNGNVLFTRQKGISLISPDKKLLWNYNAPPNTEIHTAKPVGNDRVIYALNGDPAKIVLVNILTGKTEIEFPVAVKNAGYIHGQFRRISLTDAGTVLLANTDMDKVSEYDVNGNEIWSVSIPSPWDVSRLKNGNILVTSYKRFVREINSKGETVWQFDLTDLPGFKLTTFQTAIRLANGNTILCNSCAKGDGSAVQVIEVNPDKKLVWALRSWGPEIDLGRSTTIQLLEKRMPITEKIRFEEFK